MCFVFFPVAEGLLVGISTVFPTEIMRTMEIAEEISSQGCQPCDSCEVLQGIIHLLSWQASPGEKSEGLCQNHVPLGL